MTVWKTSCLSDQGWLEAEVLTGTFSHQFLWMEQTPVTGERHKPFTEYQFSCLLWASMTETWQGMGFKMQRVICNFHSEKWMADKTPGKHVLEVCALSPLQTWEDDFHFISMHESNVEILLRLNRLTGCLSLLVTLKLAEVNAWLV